SQGEVVRAAARDVYFPVYFLEPYQGNEAALGFDLASEPIRLEALDRARDSGEVAVTAKVALVQDVTRQSGLVVVVPIYNKNQALETVEQRRAALRGFVTGVVRVGDV